MMRSASVSRRTAETDIVLSIALDGTGKAEISTGVGFLDRDLALVRGNRALSELAEHILGTTAEPGAALLPPAVLAQLEPKLRAVLDGSRAHANADVEVVLPGEAAFRRHLLVSLFPLNHEAGEALPAGIGLFVLDTSARRRGDRRRRIRARAGARLVRHRGRTNID